MFPQLNSRAKHGNIDYGNILWEQNAGLQGLSSTRCGMFLQTNVCESSSKPTGRPLLELALRLLDCQPDSFTTDADRDAGTTGRRLVVGLRSCFVQGGVNLGTALVVTVTYSSAASQLQHG